MSPAERAAAQVWWDSVYSTQSGPVRGYQLNQRDEWLRRLADVDARIADVVARGGQPDAALLQERQQVQLVAEGFDAMYKGLPEERAAYQVGGSARTEAELTEAERQVDLAEIALEQVTELVRDVESELLDLVLAGNEDPALTAAHQSALERQQKLHDELDDKRARRDAATAQATAGAQPAGAAAGPAAAGRGGGSPPGPARPVGPARPADTPTEITQLPSGTEIVHLSNPESGLEARQVYRETIAASPDREVGLAFDRARDVYIVFQGGRESLSLTEIHRRGLTLLSHFHPTDPHTGRVHPTDQFPSIEDMGNLAKATRPGQRRVEWVDFELGQGEFGHARFEVDKTRGAIECSVEIVHGGDVIEQHVFDSLEAYMEFLYHRFGVLRPPPEGTNVYDPYPAGSGGRRS
jgi:hypothetical protein